MQILSQVVLVAHVMLAMLWFAGTAFMPRQVREMLGAERTEARQRMTSLARQGRIAGTSGLAVLLTGLLLASLWPRGMAGFHNPFNPLPVRFHIGLTLALIWWIVGAFVARPVLMRIGAIVFGDAPLESAQPLAKRMAMLSGIAHLLFTVILVLMLWRL